VPLYLSNRQTRQALLGLLPDRPGMAVADIGSGLGGLLLGLARARPDGRFVGIETAPIPFAVSWFRLVVSGLAGRVSFVYGDYRRHDLAAFDVVYCFLSPVPMADVYAKASRELRPGAVLVSNSFTVPGHPADEIRDVADRRGTQLHIWRF
jgi:SAM-dependent methyltransferase